MQVELRLSQLGILEGRQKRVLECYVHPALFRQRKHYDEYFVDVSFLPVNIDIKDLMILAEVFKVEVGADCVWLEN
jgi:hypothetical protein